MTLKKSLLALSVLFLAACAQDADIGKMTVGPSSGYAASSYTGPKMQVGTVTGGEETNPMWTARVGSGTFSSALQSSLAANGMAGNDLTVNANIEHLDEPIAGFGFNIESRIAYSVIDPSGQLVMNKTITGHGEAGAFDAFVFGQRVKIANEASMKDNISQFINAARQELSGAIGARTEAPQPARPQHYTPGQSGPQYVGSYVARPGPAPAPAPARSAAPADTRLYQQNYSGGLSYSDALAQYGQDLKRINDNADSAIQETRNSCLWGNPLEWIGDQDQATCEARIAQIEANREQAIEQLDQQWRGTYMQ